ncbi:hypothetical protein [Cryobacterium sp. TMS1-13-1]|uniref:hypothetical protein n=1 Tax=Cryobacterium sp. TMS1-13-1 TaxID=1259220 RepID=UPI00106B75C3|nr:hypothetical protein [Cryobacterium sp. TMS1-13-1]TFD19201.1 hypothetical protein E3T31_16600 [Cryobacterium sp. TMS1-13-1]
MAVTGAYRAPRCGGVRLEHLTVGRCDRILQRILEEKKTSNARRARAVLSLVCGYAVRDDALMQNPVWDVQNLPVSPRKESALTPAQITAIRGRMQVGRFNRDDGHRPNYRALIDGIDTLIGTSLRVGECIRLGRCDEDMRTLPPTLIVSGRIVSNEA